MDSTQSQLFTLTQFGIRSTNVMLEDQKDLVGAIILIKDDKIYDIKLLKDLDEQEIEKINSDWAIQDVGNLIVFPGIIDCNTHLHPSYSSEWENVSYATSLAANGGVTTVIDNPIMIRSFESGSDYLRILQDRINFLKSESHVDFGVFGLLEEKTKDQIDQLVNLGVMGLKCYLINCFQHNIGHLNSDDLEDLFRMVDKNYPNLLLVLHPELATEREIYLSSPCRFVEKEKRIDLDFEIKSLDYGGAANKGSFLDELNQNKKEDEIDDIEYTNQAINSPSKLKTQIKKSKEKSEINNIVHLELLSYGCSEKKCTSQCSSSESDNEFKTTFLEENLKQDPSNASDRTKYVANFSEEDKSNKKAFTKVLKKNDDIIEVDSDDNAMTPTPIKLKSDSNDLFIKKSFFAPKNINMSSQCDTLNKTTLEKIINKDDIPKAKELFGFTQTDKEKVPEETYSLLCPKKAYLDQSQSSIQSQTSDEKSPIHNDQKPNDDTPSRRNYINEQKTFLEDKEDYNKKEAKASFATQLCLFTKIKSSGEIFSMEEDNKKKIIQSEQSNKNQESLDLPKFKKSLEIQTQFEEQSPELRKNSSNSSLSPAKKTITPLNSSLLNRRMSRKISGNMPSSTKSNMSSPDSDLSKVSFLDISKSPNTYKKTETVYNKNYRAFLAYRPLSWEENGISKIISAYNQNRSLRILIQNISLTSSFLKIREMRKNSDKKNLALFGESVIPYLLFSEKMVKKGETKYKGSPPLREKDNRRLLVENLRLGGIDLISSYHFYVPPRYKNVDDGNFRRAFNGFNIIGFSLQGLWTVLYNYYNKKDSKFKEDVNYRTKIIAEILRRIHEVLCSNPAKLLKIDHRKGTLSKGKDADLVIWNPYDTSDNRDLPPNHLFCDKMTKGVVIKTFLRGKLIYTRDESHQAQIIKPEFLTPKP